MTHNYERGRNIQTGSARTQRMFVHESVRRKTSYKVMVAFGEQTFRLLSEEARARGITIQELMRAVIIPDWFKARYEPTPNRNRVVEKTTREEDPVIPYSFSNKLRY